MHINLHDVIGNISNGFESAEKSCVLLAHALLSNTNNDYWVNVK